MDLVVVTPWPTIVAISFLGKKSHNSDVGEDEQQRHLEHLEKNKVMLGIWSLLSMMKNSKSYIVKQFLKGLRLQERSHFFKKLESKLFLKEPKPCHTEPKISCRRPSSLCWFPPECAIGGSSFPWMRRRVGALPRLYLQRPGLTLGANACVALPAATRVGGEEEGRRATLCLPRSRIHGSWTSKQNPTVF